MIKRGFEIQLIKGLATISDERTLKTLKKRSPQDFEILRNFIHNLSESGFSGID